MDEILSNYKFDRKSSSEVGSGAFSRVYIGKYIGPDRKYIKSNTDVAIKIINIHNLTEKAIDILNHEIQIMLFIKENPHPNIVNCYDVAKTQKEVLIIMDYCDSGDLKHLLKKPIIEKYAKYYFCQLVNGLKYLDKHNIIHRDIKPTNILLTDKRKVLKIADFGFAKKTTEKSLHETMCGSPLYMSEEIINNNLYNNQSDLWSIGMILYEMLYGFHPFEHCKTLPELKYSMANNIIMIPPLNTLNKTVGEDCLDLLRKLLQKKVKDRIHWDEFFNNNWTKSFEIEYSKPSNSVNSTNQSNSINILSKIPSNGSIGAIGSFIKNIQNSYNSSNSCSNNNSIIYSKISPATPISSSVSPISPTSPTIVTKSCQRIEIESNYCDNFSPPSNTLIRSNLIKTSVINQVNQLNRSKDNTDIKPPINSPLSLSLSAGLTKRYVDVDFMFHMEQ